MLCARSSQYPHRPIPPDQSRSVEVNGTGSVVVPAPAVLQGLSDHFVFSSHRTRHSVWRLTSSSSATCTLLYSPDRRSARDLRNTWITECNVCVNTKQADAP